MCVCVYIGVRVCVGDDRWVSCSFQLRQQPATDKKRVCVCVCVRVLLHFAPGNLHPLHVHTDTLFHSIFYLFSFLPSEASICVIHMIKDSINQSMCVRLLVQTVKRKDLPLSVTLATSLFTMIQVIKGRIGNLWMMSRLDNQTKHQQITESSLLPPPLSSPPLSSMCPFYGVSEVFFVLFCFVFCNVLMRWWGDGQIR